jgi:catechol 2,3-dioxygenase-like lactoylglutathione lyase family enzyme
MPAEPNSPLTAAPPGDWSRRAVLGSLGALALASQSFGATPRPDPIPVAAINHMVIKVSDLERSRKWYQGLFGMPVVAHPRDAVILRVGEGPQFLAIVSSDDSKPGIERIGFGVENFDGDRVVKVLKDFDVAAAQKQKRSGEVRFDDPAGIVVHLQGRSPTGGSRSDKRMPTPSRGLLALRDYNHFTIFVPDAKRNVRFYQQLFGLRIDTYQGPMPIIRVGQGNQFLAFVGGRPNAFVHHACFVVNEFDPDRILKLLSDYGVKPRTSKRGPAGPLQSYVVMRMPNRGGAPGGTPELYLTDPDGILLQIQDVRYSGGSGYLGDQRGTGKSAE